ncbi:MAG: YihY/virulence factor BrkB family protein [Ruminococcaceae bacterium]|nr:YihY/virulence factor BrkB family protein [Oscillospiraceae bacterium]
MKNSIKQTRIKIKKIFDKILDFCDPVLFFVRRAAKHSVAAHAAQSTLFLFISFFPFVMLFITLLNYIPLPLTEAGQLEPGFLPAPVSGLLNSLLTEINQSASGTIISVTAITALWTASKSLYAIGNGLNSVYGVKETRNYFVLRFFALIETIMFIFVLFIVLLIIVFGNIIHIWMYGISPGLAEILDKIINLRGLFGLLILTLFFSAIYVIMPDRKCKFTSQIPGGIITAVGWVGFSYLYAFYIDNFSDYSNIYGSLTAIVLFMLWLYFCMYMLFLGGEINCLLDEYRFKEKISHFYQKRKSNQE